MNLFNQIFERRKSIPMYWYNKSNDLRASAGVLWHGIHCEQTDEIVNYLNLSKGFDLSIATFPTFLLLCGLSLELIYKAIFVAKKITVPKNHNLLKLTESTGVNLTDQEIGILEILTEVVVWDGKYPVPLDNNKDAYEKLDKLSVEHLFDKVKVSDGFSVLRSNHALNWDSFNKLWLEGSRVFWECKRSDNAYI